MSKKERLLKINIWISKYLLFASPVAIGTVLWSLYVPKIDNQIISILLEICAWHFIAWFVLTVYFIFSLFIWRTFREQILTLLTFSKERDERESFIAGRASKATFYSTLAALVLLFFLSGLTVHIYKKPKEEAVDVKRGTLTIGYKFEFVNSAKDKDDNKGKNEEILKIDGIPFTQESLILFLILYHVASYHIFSRRKILE